MTTTTKTSETTAAPSRLVADEPAPHINKATNSLGAIARPWPLS